MVGLGVVGGCGGAGWQPHKPTQSIDAASFSQRYESVINNLTASTAGAGFAWSSTPPTRSAVNKVGICSWRLQQTGTWGGNKGQLRALRPFVNRALVQNGFHAAAWREDGSTPFLISQDKHNALFEVRLGNPATIAVYSPASDASCHQ